MDLRKHQQNLYDFRPVLAGLIITTCIVLVAANLVLLPMFIVNTPGSDYDNHVDYAVQIGETGKITSPHFIYQFEVLIVKALSGLSPLKAGRVAATLNYILTAIALYVWFTAELWGLPAGRREFISIGLVCIAMIVTPITLLTLSQKNLYYGYLYTNSYHNPTIILIKPLSIILFLASVQAIKDKTPRQWWFLLILVTVISALAKPSYLIALLPVVVGLTFVAFIFHRPFDWRTMIFGIILPAGLVLAWQYTATFTDTGEVASRIVLKPFEVMSSISENIGIKFVLSLLFPLVVAGLYWRDVHRNLMLLMAWAIFAFGAGYSYLLAEEGPRLKAGNFAWSGQITVFILIAASLIFFARQMQPVLIGEKRFRNIPLREWIIILVLVLHLISGVIWYIDHAFGKGSAWW